MRRRRRTDPAAVLVASLLLLPACAGRFRPATPAAAAALREAGTYSAAVRVSVGGRLLRGRASAVIAFRRPSSLRVEVAGPTGARLVAVAHHDRLTAVFPADRAVYRGAATRDAFRDVLGLSLGPADVIDLLSGVAPASVRDYRADWGPVAPLRIEGRLQDGARLGVRVEEPEVGAPVPDAAFEPPPAPGYREVSAEEASRLWR
jgi:hypothetical protein